MKRWKTTALTVFLAGSLILSACGQQSGSGEQSSKIESSGAQSSQVSAPEESGTGEAEEMYTVKVFNSSAVKVAKWSDTPIGKVFSEKFNMDLEFIPPPAGDNKEQLGLMLAAGNYPEIVNLEENDIFKQYVSAGALLPLDTYLEEMPNFQEWFKESIPFWRQTAGDGKLYNWNMQIPQDQAVFPENNDLIVRTDLLEQQGWDMPETADEWVAFLKKAKEDNPTTPDGEPTIGMSAPFGESWGMAGIAPVMYEKGQCIQIANGAVVYDAEQDIFLDMFTHPDTKESFQFFNRLYREGLLDEESFTDKNDQVTAKANSGRALSVWYTVWLSGGANDALREKGWDGMQYITAPIRSNGQAERGEKRVIMTQLTRPFATIAITKNAVYPDRIAGALDYFCSEEGQLLMQSGIEGVHYTIEDGKRIATQEYIDGRMNVEDYATKEGFALGNIFGLAAATSPVDNQPYDLSLTESAISSTRPSRINEALDQLGWETPLDWWQENAQWKPIGVASGVSVDPQSEEGRKEAMLADFRVKNSARLIQATSDEEFEKLYEELTAQYSDMDPQTVVDAYNAVYQQGLEELAQYK